MSEQIITQEGHDKLQEKLNHLNTVKRREIAERIERAKELGDLSENAEYSEAKDAQALNEGSIIELMNTLKNVTVVASSHSKDEVSMGSTVVVKNGSKERQFVIVSFNEVDPLEGKISNESPLGMSFLGKKKGDEIVCKTPGGEVKYRITSIK